MRIAVVSTPWVPVPPLGYGGTEYVVYHLVEGMVEKGHDVTLFATGDSKVSSKLEYFYPKALGNNLNLKLNPYYMLNHLYHFFKNAKNRFDIIHNNSGRFSLFFLDFLKTPVVYTLHGSYTKDIQDEYGIAQSAREALLQFKGIPYVSISNKQREGLPELNYAATIYNSIILSEYDFEEYGGEEMIWLGRVTPTKGLDLAIKTAASLKKKLKAVIFVDQGEKDYFEKEIKPLMGSQYVEVFDEVKDKKVKSDFLGEAKLLLFPIRWDEPFGIVMIEAMAAGTPVVAFAKGSVPEVVVDGVTGFIVNYADEDRRGDWVVKKTGLEGLEEAVERIYSMPEERYLAMRRACREQVEKKFTVEKMVDEYERVYEKVAGYK